MKLLIDSLNVSDTSRTLLYKYFKVCNPEKSIKENEIDFIIKSMRTQFNVDVEEFINNGWNVEKRRGAYTLLRLSFDVKNKFEETYPYFETFEAETIFNKYIITHGLENLAKELEHIQISGQLSLGEKIKTFAYKKSGSLTEYAKLIDVTPQQLHQYTSNNREPGAKMLNKLSTTGMDMNWLLSAKPCKDILDSEGITTYLHKVVGMPGNPKLLKMFADIIYEEKDANEEFNILDFLNQFVSSIKKMGKQV